MNLTEAARAWRTDGFVVLPAFLPARELRAAVDGLGSLFPSAQGFHDGTDPRAARFVGDEFAGIDTFPFASTAVSLLAAHPRLLDLAQALLEDDDIRISSAEAWAKYTGACDYDQDLHRDYLNHTLLVPGTTPEHRQVEMFLFLNDVPEDLGPPHLVPRRHTEDIPAVPNWLLKEGRKGGGRFDDDSGSPDLYEVEVSGTGPAGTVIAFETGTFHRGTRLTAPGGARFSMQLGFRPAALEWGHRTGWAAHGFDPRWVDFVHRATPRQLRVFGFPPPGHPYWTPETLAGVGLRYPGLDLEPWRSAHGAG
ncbi:phytanoyl-CoA dioxygenase family protein [Actinocorallia sp. API 0066]|uniref:phytanoyl-CoA dioxygenase family protein n=1 Tax=Actinocorallia sp. API 0066 TaxID=2896846 RepID=UPI001E440755|nr:phytanoyl-CoA dioxygenase family protein [Actinocorallia sp. API 0066]MCD0451774.1 phytanoyl-CoA dioxygenase family protein [Actinocorallia sp. API 0066]